MELGADDQISRLLQRMREERSQAKPPTVGARSHATGKPPVPDSPDEEDEEDVMPSRYVKPAEDSDDLGSVSEESEGDYSLPRAPRQGRAESLHAFERAESSESEEEDEVEDPRTKLSKRMDELRARRQMLGPPSRVQQEAVVSAPERKAATPPPPAEDSEKESPPESPAESPVKAIRPRTAHVARTSRPTAPSFIRTPVKKAKRTDPVSLYQQRQKEWQTNKFLKANKENAKEGRKLKLAEYSSRPSFHVVHEKPPVPKPHYVAPHEKRRDDVRFQTRVTST